MRINHGIQTASSPRFNVVNGVKWEIRLNSLPVNAIPAISKRSVPRGTLVAFERKNQQPDPINAKLPKSQSETAYVPRGTFPRESRFS